MSDMTDAWTELYNVQIEVIGQQQVTIGGFSDVSAIIEAVPRDSIFVDGGIGEGPTFRIQILASSVGNVEPAKYSDVSFNPVGGGNAFSGAVLSVENNNGIFYIVAGDPVTNA